ncbi:MAG: TMEM43 family protein [Chloroflexota bacterium]|nr:TMEM43 family protein [Chloroflexota bacterium]
MWSPGIWTPRLHPHANHALRAWDEVRHERRAERGFASGIWEEDSRSTTTKNRDGSSTTRTTYSYDTEWTSDPEDSSSFRQESGHHNPPMSTEGARWTVGQAALGLYAVAPATLTMPDVQQLSLNGDIVRAEKGWHLEHNFLVDRPNALSPPQVGDLRISYYAVPNRIDLTLFGRVQGDRIEPYVAKGATLYRAFTANREQAITTMNTEYTIMLWCCGWWAS